MASIGFINFKKTPTKKLRVISNSGAFLYRAGEPYCDTLVVPEDLHMINPILPHSYEIVEFYLYNKKRNQIDLSNLGPNTRKVFINMDGKESKIVGNFPQNLQVLSAPKLNEKNQKLPDSLRVLCVKTISSDFVLPEGLERLICRNPPRILPQFLTHLMYNSGRNIIIPDSVTHLRSKNLPGNYPSNLKLLCIESCSHIHEAKSDITCPSLECLIVSPLDVTGHIISNYNSVDTDDFFKHIPSFPPVHKLVMQAVPNTRMIDVGSLPRTLAELYLANFDEVAVNCSFEHMVNLKKLSCCYNSNMQFPKTLEHLSLDITYESDIFRSLDKFNNFVDKIRNVKKLALPFLSKLMYDEFCKRDIVDHLYLTTSRMTADMMLAWREMRVMKVFNIGMIRCNVISSESDWFDIDFVSNKIICTEQSSEYHVDTEQGVIKVSGIHHLFDYLGTGQELDVFDNLMDVYYFTHPGYYVNGTAKSARSAI